MARVIAIDLSDLSEKDESLGWLDEQLNALSKEEIEIIQAIAIALETQTDIFRIHHYIVRGTKRYPEMIKLVNIILKSYAMMNDEEYCLQAVEL